MAIVIIEKTQNQKGKKQFFFSLKKNKKFATTRSKPTSNKKEVFYVQAPINSSSDIKIKSYNLYCNK
jgi:hypothetical protein